jgi:hypothetical protein
MPPSLPNTGRWKIQPFGSPARRICSRCSNYRPYRII